MAPRPFWKGYLKLSLVTCPVAMMPATTDNEKVRFHTLNAKTGNRVISQYVDAVSGTAVEDDDQAKGYPRGEDDFVPLEEDDLDAVALESTRTIDIDLFVPALQFDHTGDPMTRDTKDLRRPAANVIDQRQQQIDPAGKHRTDRNDRPDANRKQPGGSDPAKLKHDAETASAPAPKEP